MTDAQTEKEPVCARAFCGERAYCAEAGECLAEPVDDDTRPASEGGA